MTTPIPPANAVAYATPTTQTAPAAQSTSSSLLDPQAFLQLLVAQLKYQDPSNPTDTSTFMSQTATLSQVQTMDTMSATLTSLVSAEQAQAATAMIGKQVTYLDAAGLRVSGLVNSAALGASGATLSVGSATVALANVLEVSAPPNA